MGKDAAQGRPGTGRAKELRGGALAHETGDLGGVGVRLRIRQVPARVKSGGCYVPGVHFAGLLASGSGLVSRDRLGRPPHPSPGFFVSDVCMRVERHTIHAGRGFWAAWGCQGCARRASASACGVDAAASSCSQQTCQAQSERCQLEQVRRPCICASRGWVFTAPLGAGRRGAIATHRI